MSDPFDALRLPAEARTPRPDFARSLRRRVEEALTSGPPPHTAHTATDTDTDTDTDREATTMSDTTTTYTTGTADTAAGAAGATALRAYLAVRDAVAAIDFYTRAFGAVEQFRVVGDDGRLGHAELRIGPVVLMLSDEYPDYGASSPTTLGGSGVLLYLEVTDCDAVHDRAVAAGAASLRPPEDQTHGNRTATLLDPFDHRWMLSQPLEPLDLEAYAAQEDGGFRVQAAPGSTTSARTPGRPTPTVWPCLNYVDARRAIDLLVQVFGFEERLVVADDDDPTVIHHSELAWPEGGGVMVATADRQGNEFSHLPTGAGSCYVVTSRVDELWSRALDADLVVVRALQDESYGNRGFSVRDAEGNIWSFGVYAGA